MSESQTSKTVDIRAEIREMREFARALPGYSSMTLLEVIQRIEDAVHPADAPPFETAVGVVCVRCWKTPAEHDGGFCVGGIGDRFTPEPKELCVACQTELPPLNQWSMPACPSCTEKAERASAETSDDPHGPPFTVDRFGSLAECVIAERNWLRKRLAAHETGALPTGMDTPWPLRDVLAKLIAATEHLLDDHACDTHGHEEFRTAANRGKELLASQEKTSADAEDAAKWRALRNCARMTAIGAAGLGPERAADDYAHVTLNFWTGGKYDSPGEPWAREWLDLFVAKARRVTYSAPDVKASQPRAPEVCGCPYGQCTCNDGSSDPRNGNDR